MAPIPKAVGVKSPDMVRLLDGPANGYMAQWNGSWPPPETFTVAVGRQSGYISVVSPEVDEASLAAAREVADFFTYRRRSASTLPDDFESPHVFRGADYVVARVASSHSEPA